MRRYRLFIASFLVTSIFIASFVFFSLWNIEVEQVSEDLYVFRGLGGNTAVLRTSEGAVVVDTMSVPIQGIRIRQLAEQLTGVPVSAIINTHYHPDHTHGNSGFSEDIRVISSDRTLHHLRTKDRNFWAKRANSLPSDIFSGYQQLKIGGKTIELIQTLPAHTNGDIVVWFVDEQTLHTGDLFFNNLFPIVDHDAGGSLRGWHEALNSVLALNFTRVIPGHGATTDRGGLKRFQLFMQKITRLIDEIRLADLEREEFFRSMDNPSRLDLFAGFDEITIFGFSIGINRESILEAVWIEGTEM